MTETMRTQAIAAIVRGLDPNNDAHWLPETGEPRISAVSERFGGPVARNEIDAVGRIRPEIGSLLRPAKPGEDAPDTPAEAPETVMNDREPDPVIRHDAHVDNDAPETPAITEAEAVRNVQTATRLLEEARQGVRDCHATVREARKKTAARLAEWLAEFPPKTADQNAREFIATGIAERQKRIDEGLPPGPVSMSHLDSIRRRPTGVDRGFRSSHSRGAYPPHMRGATIPPPEPATPRKTRLG